MYFNNILKTLSMILAILLAFYSCVGYGANSRIQPGAEQLSSYLPLLKNKRVALLANQSSVIGHQHLLDVLIAHHIHVVKLFAVEHGFRGIEDKKFSNSIDSKTGIPIISLYGKKTKPTAADLNDVDVIIFDVQDVGVRFYTYISSLQKLMEAATENNKPLIILDRPNPNGFYVDGPTLDMKYKSFIGMQPIPLVYGMTIGEYAQMLKGENWLDVFPSSQSNSLKLTVIPCKAYTHNSYYEPPVKPSPSLANIQSIYRYPTIGLMEGTVMSVGRGTKTPFLEFGHPRLTTNYTFTPTTKYAVVPPPYANQVCHGWNLSASKKSTLQIMNRQIQINYIIMAYRLYPDKLHFFKSFDYFAGNAILRHQIQSGENDAQIRRSWQPQLLAFKRIRKKYLLYPDFS